MSASLPPFPSPPTPFVYTTSLSACDKAIAALLSAKVLGFDIEWKPNRSGERNPVSVVQVATSQLAIVHQFGEASEVPSLLKLVLEDPQILKVGAGIEDDAVKLYDDFHIRLRGYLCLQKLAMRMDPARWQIKIPPPSTERYTAGGNRRRRPKRAADDLICNEPPGLKRLVAHFCSLDLNKPKSVSCSDWSQALTDEQLHYAAHDAVAGFLLFEKMVPAADEMDVLALTIG